MARAVRITIARTATVTPSIKPAGLATQDLANSLVIIFALFFLEARWADCRVASFVSVVVLASFADLVCVVWCWWYVAHRSYPSFSASSLAHSRHRPPSFIGRCSLQYRHGFTFSAQLAHHWVVSSSTSGMVSSSQLSQVVKVSHKQVEHSG